ncbi:MULTISPECIES: hypothetical protein [Kocuria]|nr:MULTISPECIES: hypothetical protein [Kocuria]GEO92305.1 hypothetical protein KFL01_16110 [Kocuria flava]GEO97247.1 hypothetical protein KTU01_33700 [Kocuria turfanensis]
MDHQLSVLVQVDLDGRYVCLLVTGCLTEASQQALSPVVARARTLLPPVIVSVDLTSAAHVEAPAVDLLRWALDHDECPHEVTSPVQILTPAELPDHRPAPAWSPSSAAPWPAVSLSAVPEMASSVRLLSTSPGEPAKPVVAGHPRRRGRTHRARQ